MTTSANYGSFSTTKRMVAVASSRRKYGREKMIRHKMMTTTANGQEENCSPPKLWLSDMPLAFRTELTRNGPVLTLFDANGEKFEVVKQSRSKDGAAFTANHLHRLRGFGSTLELTSEYEVRMTGESLRLPAGRSVGFANPDFPRSKVLQIQLDPTSDAPTHFMIQDLGDESWYEKLLAASQSWLRKKSAERGYSGSSEIVVVALVAYPSYRPLKKMTPTEVSETHDVVLPRFERPPSYLSEEEEEEEEEEESWEYGSASSGSEELVGGKSSKKSAKLSSGSQKPTKSKASQRKELAKKTAKKAIGLTGAVGKVGLAIGKSKTTKKAVKKAGDITKTAGKVGFAAGTAATKAGFKAGSAKYKDIQKKKTAKKQAAQKSAQEEQTKKDAEVKAAKDKEDLKEKLYAEHLAKQQGTKQGDSSESSGGGSSSSSPPPSGNVKSKQLAISGKASVLTSYFYNTNPSRVQSENARPWAQFEDKDVLVRKVFSHPSASATGELIGAKTGGNFAVTEKFRNSCGALREMEALSRRNGKSYMLDGSSSGLKLNPNDLVPSDGTAIECIGTKYYCGCYADPMTGSTTCVAQAPPEITELGRSLPYGFSPPGSDVPMSLGKPLGLLAPPEYEVTKTTQLRIFYDEFWVVALEKLPKVLLAIRSQSFDHSKLNEYLGKHYVAGELAREKWESLRGAGGEERRLLKSVDSFVMDVLVYGIYYVGLGLGKDLAHFALKFHPGSYYDALSIVVGIMVPFLANQIRTLLAAESIEEIRAVQSEIYEAKSRFDSEKELLHSSELNLVVTYKKGVEAFERRNEGTSTVASLGADAIMGKSQESLSTKMPPAYVRQMLDLKGDVLKHRKRVEKEKEKLVELLAMEEKKYESILSSHRQRAYDFSGFSATMMGLPSNPLMVAKPAFEELAVQGRFISSRTLVDLCKHNLVSSHNHHVKKTLEKERATFEEYTKYKIPGGSLKQEDVGSFSSSGSGDEVGESDAR
jgi:hypothetical protein